MSSRLEKILSHITQSELHNKTTSSGFEFHHFQLDNTNKPIILFIHGWPDDYRVFEKQIKLLQENYYCLAVTLPDFGTNIQKGFFRKFYIPSIGDVADDLARVLKTEFPDRYFYLVGHDWGAIFCYILEKRNPDIIKKIATIDVAPSVAMKEVPWVGRFVLLTYQFMLLYSWFLPNFIGKWIGLFFFNLLRAPGRKYGYYYTNYCHWIYASYWLRFFAAWKRELKHYCPKCPGFFAYSAPHFGLKFYSSSFLKRYREAGHIEKQYKADHWIHYKAKSEEYNNDLLKFLND